MLIPLVATLFGVSVADPRLAEVDEIFAAHLSENLPGCAVAMVDDGELVHLAGYGIADMEHGVKITPDSIFRTASLSKQFTAYAVALLAEKGEVDLDADIHEYLPELADYSAKVTVRQMVHHLGGMGDYEDPATPFFVRPGELFRFDNQDYWTTEQFYKAVAAQSLAQAPGESFRYSNLAYFLLAQLVERVSGDSLRDFAAAEIFGPLGMEDTRFYDNVNEIVPGRATGYRRQQDGSLEIYETNLSWVGDGGVYSSVRDWLIWDQALAEGTIPGGADMMRLLTTPAENSASGYPGELGYGFGLVIEEVEDRPAISHTGGWVGFSTAYRQFRDEHDSVVAFCNGPDYFGPQAFEDLTPILTPAAD